MVKTRKTTKITPEQEYKKELRRIKQFMSRASKRGFVWFDDPIPKQPKTITEKSVARLKRITPETLYKKSKFVDDETGEILTGNKGRNLEKKRAAEKAKETRKVKQKLKKKSKPKEKKESKPKEKKETKPKEKKETTKPAQKPPNKKTNENKDDTYYPNFTDIVLSNFHAQLSVFPNAEGTPLLLAWFDKLISDNGREAVAQMLQEGAEQGNIITWETVYKSNNTKTYMAEMMKYLPDQGNIYADQIMELMEQLEWWEQPE